MHGFKLFSRSMAAVSPKNRRPISTGFACLRAYPVQNGDGTALYLKPLFEREKKPKPPSTSQPGAAKPAAAAPAAASGAAKKP
jgi:hypothetical protein